MVASRCERGGGAEELKFPWIGGIMVRQEGTHPCAHEVKSGGWFAAGAWDDAAGRGVLWDQ